LDEGSGRDGLELVEVRTPSNAKVKGPASYFPSIEKAYGKPVARWFAVLAHGRERRRLPGLEGELQALLRSAAKTVAS
jgi:hypothetical protein